MGKAAQSRNLQNFCDQIGWYVIGIAPNQNNRRQLLAIILDENGRRIEILVSENDRYYELLGNKRVKEIDQKAMLREKKESKIL